MTDQNTFMETVQNVTEIVKTSEVPMTEEEILAYFFDMDLDDNQKRLVLDYIMNAERKEETEQPERDTVEQNTESELDEEEEHSSKVFQMYLEELSMLPSFNVAERTVMYEKLAAGDSSVIEDISTAWLKKVLTIAEKYMDPKLNVEDLVQEGNMALFVKLQELLGGGHNDGMEKILSEAVEEAVMSYCSTISGEREQENTLLGKVSLVQEAKKMLAVEKGQEPTFAELAEYTRMSEKELQDLEEFVKNR